MSQAADISVDNCGMEAFLGNCRVLQHKGAAVFTIFWPLCSRTDPPYGPPTISVGCMQTVIVYVKVIAEGNK